MAAGVADEAGDGVPDLGVAPGCAAGEAELDALGPADWVAVGVESADGEVSVVEVDAQDRTAGAPPESAVSGLVVQAAVR